jgi:hypothetical protein
MRSISSVSTWRRPRRRAARLQLRRARSTDSQTPSRSLMRMSRITALEDRTPSTAPMLTRVAGVESRREMRLASTP